MCKTGPQIGILLVAMWIKEGLTQVPWTVHSTAAVLSLYRLVLTDKPRLGNRPRQGKKFWLWWKNRNRLSRGIQNRRQRLEISNRFGLRWIPA